MLPIISITRASRNCLGKSAEQSVRGNSMKRRNENYIILLVSLACIGLTVESLVMGWEFWVPPLLVIGTTALWVVNISGKPEFEFRKV